ncbi:MAG: hypothetical protein U0X92_08305 [Anaerolineales bacterium]
MLKIGDRIFVSGGYHQVPDWLLGGKGYEATVLSFRLNTLILHSRDMVVQLDQRIKIRDLEGDALLLSLRYIGARWIDSEVVHVDLLTTVPLMRNWFSYQRWLIKNGLWVESHATYNKITN